MTHQQRSGASASNRHAVVIGGSMAGLLAARVLSNHFGKLTVIERDPPWNEPTPRKSVPHGQHVHVLFTSGAIAIERLFPGFFADLVAAGAQCIDFTQDVKWFHHGVWKTRMPNGLTTYLQSRPLLEWHIRQRLDAIPNVTLLSSTRVTNLSTTQNQSRVTGVQIQRLDIDAQSKTLQADLVLDASGRGSRTPKWLTDMGYKRPCETKIKIDFVYSSQMFQRPIGADPDWKMLMVYPKAPHSRVGSIINSIEKDRWLVTFGEYHTTKWPRNRSEFLDKARQLDNPELHKAIQHATELTDVITHKYPEAIRRHYERLTRFPDGLLVIGDALCSFNPIYGQGMTVCALEAQALNQCLETDALHSKYGTSGLTQKFFKQAARIIDVAWLLSTSLDFMYPETEGERPAGMRFLHWYNANLFALSSSHPEIYRRFIEVIHFVKPPTALFHPSVMSQVILCSLGRVNAMSRTRSLRPVPAE